MPDKVCLLQLRNEKTSGQTTARSSSCCYCLFGLRLDLENVFRLVKGSQSAWDCLPIPGANARAFLLQRRGVLSLQDLLDKTSPYHPYSDTEGSSQREKAIKGINERFHEVAVERENPYDEEATCISSSIAQWKELHPIGRIIKTPEGLHQEFLEEYGGGYESSGEDY